MHVVSNSEVNKAEYEKTHFIWTLYKYLGEKDSMIMGDMVMPVDSLSEELTSEYILQQLNSGNRFDFDYAPSEGDNLQIERNISIGASGDTNDLIFMITCHSYFRMTNGEKRFIMSSPIKSGRLKQESSRAEKITLRSCNKNSHYSYLLLSTTY